MHASPAQYVRGPYRVVPAPEGAWERCWWIVDDADRRLHVEASLEAARAWGDARCEAPEPARAAPLRRAR